MPKQKKCRNIDHIPNVTFFKPQGVPMRNLERIILLHDELEAIRLVDCQRLGQIEASKNMGISQSTIQRLIASARSKTTEALVNGYAIEINL